MEYGPASAEQVRQWITEGRVNSATRLQAEGTGEWRPLAEVPEFAVALPDAASPALPRFLHTCCEHCSGPIEFPEHGLETDISCPHCETRIRLREGSSPTARGALHQPADPIPTKGFTPIAGRRVLESLAARAREEEKSNIRFYLLLGAGFMLLVLFCYWRGWINELPDLLPFLAAAGVLVAVCVAVHLDWHRDKRRTEALANLAIRFRMQFTPEAPAGFLSGFSQLNLFALGHTREAGNVMQGEMDGMAVSVFDYSYVTGSGKTRRDHRQTVVSLSLPRLALPHFILRPENLFHKVASAFGWHDIDFAEAPNFSKRYLLRGAQEHSVRAAFNPGVLDFLERHAGVSAEGCSSHLIYYRAGRTQKPIEIRQFMREACELARLLGYRSSVALPQSTP
jgi:hypothetical protein